MVKDYATHLYHEIRRRGLTSLFLGKNDVNFNLKRLNEIVEEMNVTKCSLFNIETEHPGSGLHLKYLLQANEGINFGICESFKVWMNSNGWRYGCKYDAGKGISIQAYCYGNTENCKADKKGSENEK